MHGIPFQFNGIRQKVYMVIDFTIAMEKMDKDLFVAEKEL